MRQRGITRCRVRVRPRTQTPLSMQEGDAAALCNSQAVLGSVCMAAARAIVAAVVDGVAAAAVPGVDALVAVTVARMGVWAALCSTAVAEISRAVGKA